MGKTNAVANCLREKLQWRKPTLVGSGIVLLQDRSGLAGWTEVRSSSDKFPWRPYTSPEGYFAAYRDEIIRAWSTVDGTAITRAAEMLSDCIARDGIVYACGNGGSAAIANHLLCDYLKGIQTETTAKPRVVSLSSHLELLTAIGNDIGYADTFVYQLLTMARPGDLLMTISASGDSANIVRAA